MKNKMEATIWGLGLGVSPEDLGFMDIIQGIS